MTCVTYNCPISCPTFSLVESIAIFDFLVYFSIVITGVFVVSTPCQTELSDASKEESLWKSCNQVAAR